MKQEEVFVIDKETLMECIESSIDTADQSSQPMIISSR